MRRCGRSMPDAAAARLAKAQPPSSSRPRTPLRSAERQFSARSSAAVAQVRAKGCSPIRDDGEGLVRAITLALEDSGLRADEVGMIVAHGNATRQGDASEARAIRSVFGVAPPPVTAFKWALGHLLAASGIIEAVLALAALRDANGAGNSGPATSGPGVRRAAGVRFGANAQKRRRARPFPGIWRHKLRARRARQPQLTST